MCGKRVNGKNGFKCKFPFYPPTTYIHTHTNLAVPHPRKKPLAFFHRRSAGVACCCCYYYDGDDYDYDDADDDDNERLTIIIIIIIIETVCMFIFYVRWLGGKKR